MGGCAEFFGRIGTSGRGFGGRRYCGPELKSGRRNTASGNDYSSERNSNSASGYSNAAGRDSYSTCGNGNASRKHRYSSSWNYDARSNHSEYYDAAGGNDESSGNDESTEPRNDATERYSEHDQSKHHESWKYESFKPGNDNATQRFDNSTTVELENNEAYAKAGLWARFLICKPNFLNRNGEEGSHDATVGIVE